MAGEHKSIASEFLVHALGCVAVHLLVFAPFGVEEILHPIGDKIGEALGFEP